MTEALEEVWKRELVTCEKLFDRFKNLVQSKATKEFERGNVLAGTALASIGNLSQAQLLDLIDEFVASGMRDEAVLTYSCLRSLMGEENALEFISRLVPVDPLFVDQYLEGYWARRYHDRRDYFGNDYDSYGYEGSGEPEEEDFFSDPRWEEEQQLLADYKRGNLEAAIALLALGDYLPDELRKVVRGINPKNKNIASAILSYTQNYPEVSRPSDVCGLVEHLLNQGLPEEACALSLKVVQELEWPKVRSIHSFWKMRIFDLRLLTEPGFLES
jgi:hypothetical protein